jgi:hypothetical protein
MTEFIKQKFDTLVLVAVLAGLVVAAIHFAHHGQSDGEVLQWVLRSIDNVIGALLLALSGRYVQRAIDRNGKPPEPPSA